MTLLSTSVFSRLAGCSSLHNNQLHVKRSRWISAREALNQGLQISTDVPCSLLHEWMNKIKGLLLSIPPSSYSIQFCWRILARIPLLLDGRSSLTHNHVIFPEHRMQLRLRLSKMRSSVPLQVIPSSIDVHLVKCEMHLRYLHLPSVSKSLSRSNMNTLASFANPC